jgi:hypothetical protein
LSIQPNGGNVGIGTTAPGKKLDVVGTTETSIRVADTGGSSLELYQQATDSYLLTTNALRIYTSGSARMSILNNGNVGIGTTSPSTKLVVVSSVNTIVKTKGGTSTNQGSSYYVEKAGDTSTLTAFGDAASIIGGTPDANACIWTSTSVPLLYHIGGSEKIRFTSDGNVGIGTSSPSQKLEVNGTILATGFTNNNITISGGDLLFAAESGGDGFQFDYYATKMYIGNNVGSTWHMVIQDNGNIGIGTTAPAYKLEVNGSFAASTKSFKIDHPTKTGKKLVYGSLESPYHGIRLTGKDKLVNGRCIVQLPDYICKLARHESVNVQLTGIKCGKTLYIDDINISENYFVVAYDKSLLESNKTYEFFWDFTAIRSDVPELITEV